MKINLYHPVPAGESCSAFLASKIQNGGVIYSDLLLSVGVTAHFVCNDGFSLHGHGKYECSSDGVWIGEDSEEIKEYPTCESMWLASILLTLLIKF